ncbi:MAG TPA: hypothetical protein VKV77_12270 [Methylovirgula sp.]|nr:hypothetical protein [Methylovirgula sp.]
MTKLIFGLGLVTSLAIFAIALMGAPATSGDGIHQAVTQDAAKRCNVEVFSLDDGYGISRKAERRVCTQ